MMTYNEAQQLFSKRAKGRDYKKVGPDTQGLHNGVFHYVMDYCKATSRKTEAHWVNVCGIHILFSYETAVAFHCQGGAFRKHNHWGPTTGRHMKECGVSQYEAVEDEEFDRLLDHAVLNAIVARVAHRLDTAEA